MPAGRPLKFKSVEEMQAKIDSYFAACDDDNPPLISGLAYHLDMNTESLRRYAENEEFYATIKRAKQRVEMFLEKRLHQQSPVGSIFSLKNNFGWKDKTEQELTGADGGAIKTEWTVRVVDARSDASS
jgi:hypothetical protein